MTWAWWIVGFGFLAAIAAVVWLLLRSEGRELRTWRPEADRLAKMLGATVDVGWLALAVTDGKVCVIWTGDGDGGRVTRIERAGKTEEVPGWITADAVVAHLSRPCLPGP